MTRWIWLGLVAWLAWAPAFGRAAEVIQIVQAPGASTAQRLAVDELLARLRRLYPDEQFVLAETPRTAARQIIVAEFSTGEALLAQRIDPGRVPKAESFVVDVSRTPRDETAVIAGADARGVVYGVYALLERLGCGFFLCADTEPAPRRGPLSFAGWALADTPPFGDRIALNWQNFLSSAAAWERADWERYIDATVRLRFNDPMVHAYGNSPMFTFAFNGINKPVGYVATTERGCDWGTQHVNDVRRLIGGEVFSGPVFGASVAQRDPEDRAERTAGLMRQVFQHARDRGLGITFALDVDTVSANPQDVIATLPPEAKNKLPDSRTSPSRNRGESPDKK